LISQSHAPEQGLFPHDGLGMGPQGFFNGQLDLLALSSGPMDTAETELFNYPEDSSSYIAQASVQETNLSHPINAYWNIPSNSLLNLQEGQSLSPGFRD
jgi:hypothetical protein